MLCGYGFHPPGAYPYEIQMLCAENLHAEDLDCAELGKNLSEIKKCLKKIFDILFTVFTSLKCYAKRFIIQLK